MLAGPVLPSPSRRSPRTISPKSQVRFSVPDTDFLDESQIPVLGSPSKIVFPKSFEDDDTHESASEDLTCRIRKLGNEGHFMDFHSGMMINVPEEIWNFHTQRRLTKQHRRSKSTGDQSSSNNNEELEISKSVQSIVADTLSSMGRSHCDKSSETKQVHPLNVRLENNYDLHLTSYSPLNGYNVPVPLEISLPPYLSPENKGRKRTSLIFDGKSYSPFNTNADERALQEDEEYKGGSEQDSPSLRDTEDDVSISANSIPSATHDISFDINSLNNVDQELGIDEYANVDLKVQRRNLKREGFPKPSFVIGGSGIVDEPPLDQGSEINEPESPDIMSRRKSLDILSTPLKQIHIPDFELNPTSPISTVGSLKFFDKLENQEEENHSNPSREKDKLDMNFRFPLLPPKEDDDLIMTNNAPMDPRFEARRNRLAEQGVVPSGGRRHAHSRSRSIHSVQEMFAASTPSPVTTNKNGIFNNGSAILENHSLQKDVRKQEQVSSTGSRGGFAEDEYGLPFVKLNSDPPATPSPMEGSRNERIMAPTPFSRRHREKSVIPASVKYGVREANIPSESLSCKESELESDLSWVRQDVYDTKEQLSYGKKRAIVDQKPFISGNETIYDSTDKSLKIMAERNLDDDHEEIEVNETALCSPLKEVTSPIESIGSVKPIKSIQSFTGPVIPPDNEYENIISIRPEHIRTNYRPLSPSRSLSNSDSQSSTNSQFSKQTQSSRTSYPMGLEVTNPLTGNLNKKATSRPFSYQLDSSSANRTKFQSLTIPGFGAYDSDNVPLYHQLQEETLSLDDNTKDLQGQHPFIQENSLVASGCNESDSALHANADLGWKSPLDNQRNLHIHQRSGNSEERIQKYDYDDLHNEATSTSSSPNNIRHGYQLQYGTGLSFEKEELHGSNNSKMLEDEREPNQTLQYAQEKQEDFVSYAQKSSPSSEFREVLETLDSMVSSSQRTRSSPLEKSLYQFSLDEPVNSKTKPIVNVGYHVEYEEKDGKVVEILVLDDDSKDSIRYMADELDFVSPKGISQNNSPSKSHDEILKMCEDTASDAKDIILQLIDDRKLKKTRKRKFTRPPPPIATKEMAQFLYDDGYHHPHHHHPHHHHPHHHRPHHHPGTSNPSTNGERYLGNLKRKI